MYLFFTKNSEDDKFYETACTNNKDILSLIDKNNIIEYSIDNVRFLLTSLDALVTFLIADKKRVVLAPTGPKQFALASLIINLFHQEITTYRISHGTKTEATDKKADEDKSPIITLVNFKEGKNIIF